MRRATKTTRAGAGQLARADKQPLVQSLHCHACGADLGTMTTSFSTATAVDDRRGLEDLVEETISEDITIGLKIEPAPGFVNAKERHESGHRWYRKRRGSALQLKGRVRLPAVMTCECGADNLVMHQRDSEPRQFAELPRDQRDEKFEDVLAERAGDLYIQREIDFRRGK